MVAHGGRKYGRKFKNGGRKRKSGGTWWKKVQKWWHMVAENAKVVANCRTLLIIDHHENV
ncbi:hypothetical protein [Trichocoleus sp. DQ-U1]|uniref:hypothetical protein n=1 Tax=Trichocoleus sp. DQ-U1 TaxID=2933926 RepID=UPI003298049D